MASTAIELGWHWRWILNHAFKLCPCGLCHTRKLGLQALSGLRILPPDTHAEGCELSGHKNGCCVFKALTPSKPICRFRGKVNRLGEVRCGHFDLILNSQLSDGLTTEESINEHLPSVNDAFSPWLSSNSNPL